MIRGGGGADNLSGGADDDSLDEADDAVVTRDTSAVSLGFMIPAQPGGGQLYLVGSDVADTVTATYSPGSVSFTLAGASFDQSPAAAAGCTVAATTATCPLSAPLDSIVLAGMDGSDSIAATGFPDTTSVILLGGAGADDLAGGELSEDVVVDGPEGGADTLAAAGGDDALLHNGGADDLFGGGGNDLFLSVSICDAEEIDGGPGRDNASWARLAEPVEARLDQGRAGEPGGSEPSCPGDAFDTLTAIEDLETSNSADVLHGDAGPNQLLGHKGPDTYLALAGADSILANSGDDDPLIDCGDDVDSAIIDRRPQFDDAAPVNCENVREGDPNEFQTITELPPPPLLEPPPPPPRPDTRPPRTRITARPAALLLAQNGRRRVAFRFASNEAGSTFRCRIDRRPFRLCTSPRVFNVGLGRHAVRIFAIDPAGNRDRTPAVLRFRVRRTATPLR